MVTIEKSPLFSEISADKSEAISGGVSWDVYYNADGDVIDAKYKDDCIDVVRHHHPPSGSK
jgi:hypothetical protein